MRFRTVTQDPRLDGPLGTTVSVLDVGPIAASSAGASRARLGIAPHREVGGGWDRSDAHSGAPALPLRTRHGSSRLFLDGCAPSLSVWPSGARRKRRRRLRPRRRPSGRWPRVSLPGFSAKTVGRERCGSETSLEMGASPPLLCPRSSCSGTKRALARTDVVLSPPLRPRGVCVHEKRKVSKRKTAKKSKKGKRSKKK